MNSGHPLSLALAAISFAASFLASPTSAQSPFQIDWSRQPGSTQQDSGAGVAVDGSGNVYLTGATFGSIVAGANSSQQQQAYLIKYDASGNRLWSRQSSSADYGESVAVDGAGNIFMGGFNFVPFQSYDAQVSKYDSTGNLIWSRSFGTSTQHEMCYALAADNLGTTYLTGYTKGSLAGPNAGKNDIFVAKYNANGTAQWTKQLGSNEDDTGRGIAVDSLGNIYVCGRTEGSVNGGTAFGEFDALLAKYDSSGNIVWSRQVGTSADDFAEAVAIDGFGNIYIGGDSRGSLFEQNLGGLDAFVAKYDPSGNLLWSQQFGTPVNDFVDSIAIDVNGNAFVTGSTWGSLGATLKGPSDIFLTKLDAAGNSLWVQQWGSFGKDEDIALALDSLGHIYLAGDTSASLAGPYQGGLYDPFLIKLSLVPEPQSLGLLIAGIPGLWYFRRWFGRIGRCD